VGGERRRLRGAHCVRAFPAAAPTGLGGLHVAYATALGAFGLAVAANIQSLSIESSPQHQQRLLLSLGIWPVMTAVPAFLVALGTSAVLARALRSPPGG
jgi:hypothetical protein